MERYSFGTMACEKKSLSSLIAFMQLLNCECSYSFFCTANQLFGFEVQKVLDCALAKGIFFVNNVESIEIYKKFCEVDEYFCGETSFLKVLELYREKKLLSFFEEAKIFLDSYKPECIIEQAIVFKLFTNLLLRLRIINKNKVLYRDFIDFCFYLQDGSYILNVNSKRSLTLYYKMRALAIQAGDVRTVANVDSRIGTYFFNIAKTEKELNKFYKICERGVDSIFSINDTDIIAQSLYSVARYYYMNGDYEKSVATVNFFLSLPHNEYHIKLSAWFFGQAAFSLICLGRFQEATNMMKYVVEISTKLNAFGNIIYAKLLIAYAYICEKNIDDALSLLDEIENELHNKKNVLAHTVRLERTKAYAYFIQGDINKAYDCYTKNFGSYPDEFVLKYDYISMPFCVDLLAAFEDAGLPHPYDLDYNETFVLLLQYPCKVIRLKSQFYITKKLFKDSKEKAFSFYTDMIKMLSSYDDSIEFKEFINLQKTLFNSRNFTKKIAESQFELAVFDNTESSSVYKKILSRLIFARQFRVLFSNTKDYHGIISFFISIYSGFRAAIFTKSEQENILLANADLRQKYVSTSSYDEKLLNSIFIKMQPSYNVMTTKTLFLGDTREYIGLYFPVFLRDNNRYILYLEFYASSEKKLFLREDILLMLSTLLKSELEEVLQYVEHKESIHKLKEQKTSFEQHDEIVYADGNIKALLQQVDALATTDAAMLIRGESGVGKEMFALRIHERSGVKGNFVAVNMSSIPEELWESEFFGHEKGSFTGAFAQKKGLFELAHEGTLFIDELGDISLRIQVKLLRVLQEKQFMRIGGTQLIKSNFRLISATHVNLEEAIKKKLFRSDLFYRINIIPVTIPPLRERKADIKALVDYFLTYFSTLHSRSVTSLSTREFEFLYNYSWPGNVRELKNFVERFVLLKDSEDATRLSQLFLAKEPVEPVPVEPSPISKQDDISSKGFYLNELITIDALKKKYFAYAYIQKQGLVSGKKGLAKILGISENTAYAWVSKMQLRDKLRLTFHDEDEE